MAMPNTQARGTPAVHGLLEVLAGCGLGLACAALAGFVAARVFAGSSDGWGDLVGAILGGLAGQALGASLGVFAAGRRLHGSGAYWPCLAGSVAGVALVLLLAEPLRLNANTLVMQIALAVVPPILAALAFHAARRQR